MAKNIDQVFIANPITSNASTDLMYFGQSPYGAGNDAAMTYANFSAQFGAPYTASALTEVNDTNVTLTLGGTPSTALLHAVSITAGWAGQLSVARGGTGAATLTGLLTGNGTSAFTGTAITQFNVITGGATNLPNSVAPSATSGVPLISQGASSQPIFGTAVVAGGGTGVASFTVNGVIISNTTATGVLAALALTDGQVVIGSSAGAPLAGTLTAGTGITITNGHNSITVASNGATPVVDQTSSSVTMTSNTAYVTDNGASLVTYTLPTSSAIGDWLEIIGKSAGAWSIAQASGQEIFVAPTNHTTIGATGSLSAVNQYDCVKLRCITANTTWVVTNQQSTGLTIV